MKLPLGLLYHFVKTKIYKMHSTVNYIGQVMRLGHDKDCKVLCSDIRQLLAG